jgi:altronate dehydratase
MRNALVIDEKDSVAVVIHPIKAGEEVVYAFPSGKEAKLTASQDIPLFHKVALRDVPKGDPVIKYGEYIGVATADIKKGDWVHTHNLESSDELEHEKGGTI